MKLSAHRHPSYQSALIDYSTCCQQVVSSMALITSQQLHQLFQIHSINNTVSLQEPKQLLPAHKAHSQNRIQISKQQQPGEYEVMLKTTKKRDNGYKRDSYLQNTQKQSPLWTRLQNHLSNIDCSYQKLKNEWDNNPETYDKLYQQEIEIVQSFKQCKLKHQDEGSNQEEEVDQDEEKSQLRTTKKVFDGKKISNSSGISKWMMVSELQKAPKKVKRYRRIYKIEGEISESHKYQQKLNKIEQNVKIIPNTENIENSQILQH